MHKSANKSAPICKRKCKLIVQDAFLSYYAYCSMQNMQKNMLNMQNNICQYAKKSAPICKRKCKLIVSSAYLSYSAYCRMQNM